MKIKLISLFRVIGSGAISKNFQNFSGLKNNIHILGLVTNLVSVTVHLAEKNTYSLFTLYLTHFTG